MGRREGRYHCEHGTPIADDCVRCIRDGAHWQQPAPSLIIRQQTTAITCDGCEELEARDERIAELTEALRNLLGAVSHNYVYNTNAGGLAVLNAERVLNGEK